MIDLEDLKRVVALAKSAAANSDDRAAVWALEREILAAAPPDVASTFWYMETDPEGEAGA